MVTLKKAMENKYFKLVPTDKSKVTLKKHEELGNKIRYLIRSKTNNSDNYDEKNMRIKFHSDYDLPLKKTLQLCIL